MIEVERVEYLNRVCYYKKTTTILHREDDPAITYNDGEKQWWINGSLHREDGPAVIYKNGTKKWYFNGKSHREDGPAIVWSDGDIEWYLNNKQLSKEEWFEALSVERKEKMLYSEYFIGV
jgi:hypothetical protein